MSEQEQCWACENEAAWSLYPIVSVWNASASYKRVCRPMVAIVFDVVDQTNLIFRRSVPKKVLFGYFNTVPNFGQVSMIS